MKWASFFSLVVVFLFLLCAHDVRAQGRFDVTVQVVNAGVPIPGANIKIVNSSGNRSESFSGVSDGSGKATIHVETIFGGTFQVLAEKALFHPGEAKFTAGGDSRDKDKNLEIELAEDSLAIEITVHVTDQASSATVAGVTVTLTGRLTNTAFETATTDQNGDARLYLVNNTGSFTISTSSNNFERFEGPIVVERGQRQQSVPVALKKKVVKGRQNATFFAIVKTKDEDGKLVPLPGALVTLVDQRITAVTDARGSAELRAEAGVGDEVTMTASKDGYSNQRKVATMTFETVGAAGGVVSVSGGAEFQLDKDPGDGVELLVQVLDSKTNRPVQNAAVTAHPYASELRDRKASTGDSGTASFLNADAIPVDKAIKGVRVMVSKTGYTEKWSDVDPDLLKVGQRRFTVYIDPSDDDGRFVGTWKCNGCKVDVEVFKDHTYALVVDTKDFQSGRYEGGKWRVYGNDICLGGITNGPSVAMWIVGETCFKLEDGKLRDFKNKWGGMVWFK